MKFQENVFFVTTTEATNIYPILEQSSYCQMTTFSNNIVKWDCEIFETIPTQIHEHHNLTTFKIGSIEYNEIQTENNNWSYQTNLHIDIRVYSHPSTTSIFALILSFTTQYWNHLVNPFKLSWINVTNCLMTSLLKKWTKLGKR